MSEWGGGLNIARVRTRNLMGTHPQETIPGAIKTIVEKRLGGVQKAGRGEESKSESLSVGDEEFCPWPISILN